jgi:hypothetical protein
MKETGRFSGNMGEYEWRNGVLRKQGASDVTNAES